jgi:hypothetical protein
MLKNVEKFKITAVRQNVEYIADQLLRSAIALQHALLGLASRTDCYGPRVSRPRQSMGRGPRILAAPSEFGWPFLALNSADDVY